MLILGILSATVGPKFFTSKNLTEYTYRSDIITKLRLLQTRAMQQTNNAPANCHRFLINSTRLGVPRHDCDATPTFGSLWVAQSTDVIAELSDNITFSTNATGNTFTFDSMGRPENCNVNACQITVSGEQTLSIIIEKEGYIHAI
jgi:MSHA pilin protein MshC